nr:putative EGF-like and EMI domain-containing protein 1 [Gorilla gorilla gorilla]
MNGGKCQEGKSECSCPAGCRVILCNENCLEGAYGAGCTSECQCVEENTLECSAKNGSCTCKSGYQGNRCQKDGLWGPEGWFSSAPCENGGQCNKKTGNCDCTPDYTRKSCTISCPEDHYGQNCVQWCSCGSGQCDPVTGVCQCPPGRMGTRCQEGNNGQGHLLCPSTKLAMLQKQIWCQRR